MEIHKIFPIDLILFFKIMLAHAFFFFPFLFFIIVISFYKEMIDLAQALDRKSVV